MTRLLAGPDVVDPIAVVVITMFDVDDYVDTALQSGARTGRRRSGIPAGRAGSRPGRPARFRPVRDAAGEPSLGGLSRTCLLLVLGTRPGVEQRSTDAES
ncbi:hypothetical protein [Actinoplanes derwentensis]|uniref:hypothetical protein n=1 Tax=Actinoplanes derwentensis TaxID=113562 RepID=UPI0018D4814A